MFWVIVIAIIIVIYIVDASKDTGSIATKNKSSSFNYKFYYDLWDEIIHQCWNRDTYEFNWQTWFDRRDEIIWCGNETVLKTIDSDFRAYGIMQIYKINALLENSFDSKGNVRVDIMDKFLSCESNIILNLCSMFAFKNGEYKEDNIPEDIKKYREALYYLCHEKIEWNKQNILKITHMGNAITRRS